MKSDIKGFLLCHLLFWMSLSFIDLDLSIRFSRYRFNWLSSVSGDGEIRTHDPLLARQVLSQLSYTPKVKSVKSFLSNFLVSSYSILITSKLLLLLLLWLGLNGLEPSTSRLSGVRSNQLSYKPIRLWQPPTLPHRLQCSTIGRLSLNHRVRDENGCFP